MRAAARVSNTDDYAARPCGPCCPSRVTADRGETCRWLPPLLFSIFNRALTFRLHNVTTARLPAYIKDPYPATHLPPLWWLADQHVC